MKAENVWTITVVLGATKTSKRSCGTLEKREEYFLRALLYVPGHEWKKVLLIKKRIWSWFLMKSSSNRWVLKLDYFRLPDSGIDEYKAKDNFEASDRVCVKYDKPLMIHYRSSKDTDDAHAGYLEHIKIKTRRIWRKKIEREFPFFHISCWSTQNVWNIGFTVSFTGPNTFLPIGAIVKYVPLDRMMARNRCTVASPVPYRGKRNNHYILKLLRRWLS